MKKYVLILVLIVLASQNAFSQEKIYNFDFITMLNMYLQRSETSKTNQQATSNHFASQFPNRGVGHSPTRIR